ncbi:hypothetical protein E5676_scaffold194G00150 [Cucumis melo var. makuwa]|uniref:Uncharacterized protein n=1 Tax=Cucumis melo var. makuwa TaxID=1194695 RepID=A0A5D3BDM5_CUCMM|nr:hypothetical protein E5676_scaffold194G00150 [Cucumis melo var. makuwa]
MLVKVSVHEAAWLLCKFENKKRISLRLQGVQVREEEDDSTDDSISSSCQKRLFPLSFSSPLSDMQNRASRPSCWSRFPSLACFYEHRHKRDHDMRGKKTNSHPPVTPLRGRREESEFITRAFAKELS